MSSNESMSFEMVVINHKIKGAVQVRSPNQDERPSDEISLIVLHGISLPAGKYGGPEVCDLFTNCLDTHLDDFNELQGLRVSSHLFIRRKGEVIQFVPFNRRAWHAGVSSFKGRESCNDFSIGIELEGTDTTPYDKKQYETLAEVCSALMEHYKMTDITSHSAIAPDRKTDPGPAFKWSTYKALLAMLS